MKKLLPSEQSSSLEEGQGSLRILCWHFVPTKWGYHQCHCRRLKKCSFRIPCWQFVRHELESEDNNAKFFRRWRKWRRSPANVSRATAARTKKRLANWKTSWPSDSNSRHHMSRRSYLLASSRMFRVTVARAKAAAEPARRARVGKPSY